MEHSGPPATAIGGGQLVRIASRRTDPWCVRLERSVSAAAHAQHRRLEYAAGLRVPSGADRIHCQPSIALLGAIAARYPVDLASDRSH
jgi:hypothetical protein